MSDEVIEVIENLKIEFLRLQRWDKIKIATRFCETWENADTLHNERNEKILKYIKENELTEREKENPCLLSKQTMKYLIHYSKISQKPLIGRKQLL